MLLLQNHFYLLSLIVCIRKYVKYTGICQWCQNDKCEQYLQYVSDQTTTDNISELRNVFDAFRTSTRNVQFIEFNFFQKNGFKKDLFVNSLYDMSQKYEENLKLIYNMIKIIKYKKLRLIQINPIKNRPHICLSENKLQNDTNFYTENIETTITGENTKLISSFSGEDKKFLNFDDNVKILNCHMALLKKNYIETHDLLQYFYKKDEFLNYFDDINTILQCFNINKNNKKNMTKYFSLPIEFEFREKIQKIKSSFRANAAIKYKKIADLLLIEEYKYENIIFLLSHIENLNEYLYKVAIYTFIYHIHFILIFIRNHKITIQNTEFILRCDQINEFAIKFELTYGYRKKLKKKLKITKKRKNKKLT